MFWAPELQRHIRHIHCSLGSPNLVGETGRVEKKINYCGRQINAECKTEILTPSGSEKVHLVRLHNFQRRRRRIREGCDLTKMNG